MEIADTEAEACRGLEASTRCVHADCWRCEGVVWWEHERAPVLAAFVGRVRWAGDDVVPFEDVGFGWVGDNELGWIGGDGFVFFCQPSRGGERGHDVM